MVLFFAGALQSVFALQKPQNLENNEVLTGNADGVSTDQSTYDVFADVGFGGDFTADIGSYNVSLQEECEQLCTIKKACEAFTYFQRQASAAQQSDGPVWNSDGTANCLLTSHPDKHYAKKGQGAVGGVKKTNSWSPLVPTIGGKTHHGSFVPHLPSMPSVKDFFPSSPFNKGSSSAKHKTRGEKFRQVLTNHYDVQYTGVVNVGGQDVATVIDTGSFELLVFSDHCVNCGAHHGLFRDKHQSFQEVGFVTEHSFGSGTTKSNEAFDVVKVGPLKIQKQHFWEVFDADMAILQDDYFHAILGMGPPGSALKFAELNVQDMKEEASSYRRLYGEDAPKELIAEEKQYEQAVIHARNVSSLVHEFDLQFFSVCLGREPGSIGYFTWNDDATKEAPNKFKTLNNVGDIYWSLNLTGVRLGAMHSWDKQLSSNLEMGCDNTKCTAVVDSGTSLIVAPNTAIAKVQEALRNWHDPVGDCSDLTGLPNLEFHLNGELFILPPESYIGSIDGDVGSEIQRLMPQLNTTSKKVESCTPLLMASEADSQLGQLWILGMPFLRKYYTTFQFGKWYQAKSMAFSIADDSCQPTYWGDEVLNAQRRKKAAPLRIKASDIRIPPLVRRMEAKASAKEYHEAKTRAGIVKKGAGNLLEHRYVRV